MSLIRILLTVSATSILGTALTAMAADPELVHAKNGSGIYGYRDTPVMPWCGFRVHDPDRPAPKRVKVSPAPDRPAAPPSDAIVLFDGKDLSKWEKSDWKVIDNQLEAGNQELATKESFGDCQLHIEWMGPVNFKGPWYNQGNNGVNLLGVYEIQIFDSWNEKIYPDGMSGAVYGQTPPMVNACLPPGEWQAFDILFTAPVFEDQKLIKPARVTVLYNGVLVQLNQEIYGEAVHRRLPEYNQKLSKAPLTLGGHGCPVRFRNIWIRPLP